MNKNKFFHLFFLFFLSYFLPNLGNQAKETFKGREWEFMQHEITNKIYDKRYTFSNKLKMLAPVLIPILSGGAIGAFFKEYVPQCPDWPKYKDPNYHEKKEIRNIIQDEIWKIEKRNHGLFVSVFFLSFVATILLNKACHIILKNNAEFEAYTEFIKNWPKNKLYTPESLQSAFDELYILYKKYGSSSQIFINKYDAIKEVVSQALFNRFSPPVVIYNSPQPIYYY